MGVALGWKRVAPQWPYVNGEVWNDGVSRNGNQVTFSFNLRLVVPTAQAWWNYAWYVNLKCGNVQANDKKVKNLVYRNDIITGQEFWYSSFNGNFTGTITVDGTATNIPVEVAFHDSAGNWGDKQIWYVTIPSATPMSDIKTSLTNLQPDSATLKTWIDYNGDYSTITRWDLYYGANSVNDNHKSITGNKLSTNWSLTNLQPSTYYRYKVSVTNSAGFTKTTSGSFTTEDSEIGRLIISGQPTKILTGWIVKPNGQVQRIKQIKKVVG